MPRTRKFFRLKNSSKDSGLSFHCCGKPEDLLDEPLDLVNQKRQPRGKAEVTKPETKISERDFDARLVATLCHEHRLMKEKTSHESHPSAPGSSSNWPLQSLLFRSTASSSNLKRKSRVERTKLWAKKYIDPHINDKSLANEEKKHSTNQDPITPFADEDSGDDVNPKLRPARSMPLLNQPTFSNATHHHRRRSKCLSSFSFSGLDALVGSHSDPSKTSQQKSVLRFPLVDPDPMDTATTRTDSAKSTSSKLHTSIFSKNSKFSSFLSATSWNSFLSHRQEKE
ncbi:hypothetical protein PCANC_09044 [Puccinia coronata f. sp. avenae]|uniref:Uncharacterized protein n=1 Tax=Puccinia coronata f. sp. avenae TaxID=200324 RepID=A0A2N5T217_9BASI|nr:hypothetical protein PCANC_09044 [Puccinia coronata f. sp. avenae]